MSDFNDDRLERARQIREFKKNPPKKEVGMNENPWAKLIALKKENDAKRETEMQRTGFDPSSISSETLINNSSQDNDGLNGFGSNNQPQLNLGSFNNQVGQQPQQVKPGAEVYVIAVFKEIGATIKGTWESFKGNDLEFASKYGRALMFTGVSVLIASLIFLFVSFFINWKRPLALSAGGILLIAGGLFIQTIVYNKTADEEEDEEDGNENDEDIANMLLNGNEEVEEENNSYDDFLEEDYMYTEEPKEEVKPSFLDKNIFNSIPERLSFTEATKGLSQIDPEMYTRSFLYERYQGFLPKRNPNFNKMRELSENSEEFLNMDILLREACIYVGIKEENLPIIEKLEENDFILRMTIKRAGLTRVKDIANEIANAYKYDNYGRIIHEGAYATTTEFGNTLIITLFKGTSTVVTLGDVFSEGSVRDFLLDAGNLIPIVLGVDELGDPVFVDFKKMDSVIISGLPRTGKSLTMQSIVSQLCMFLSPKEVQFHIMDLKDGISDFQGIETKHIKSFSNTPEKCINTIRYLVKEVGAERTKFLQSYGFKNILDFKKKYPDIEFPFIYLVVDEMMKLAESMDKEEKAEFQELLSSLISMMPALGVRVILIPHRIVNDVISKNSYSLVPCRINVMGKGEELEKAMGISANSFPYKLTNEGNCAVMLKGYKNGEPFFCHSAMLTSNTESEDVKDIFKLIDTIWGKVNIEKSEESFDEEVKSQEKVSLWD